MSNLTSLKLTRMQLGDDECVELAKANLPRLTRLDLSENGIRTKGCSALIDSPLVSELVELRLDRNYIPKDDYNRMVNSTNLPNLKNRV